MMHLPNFAILNTHQSSKLEEETRLIPANEQQSELLQFHKIKRFASYAIALYGGEYTHHCILFDSHKK
jgi:hypothetical protein